MGGGYCHILGLIQAADSPSKSILPGCGAFPTTRTIGIEDDIHPYYPHYPKVTSIYPDTTAANSLYLDRMLGGYGLHIFGYHRWELEVFG